jgi:hypothetical protein
MDLENIFKYVPMLKNNKLSHEEMCEFQQNCLYFQYLDIYDNMKWHSYAMKVYKNIKYLNKLSLNECLCLLVSHAGKDSICDGHFERMVNENHILAIVVRIEELSKA